MITPTKPYKNWPKYDDDLVNKIYVDESILNNNLSIDVDNKINDIKTELNDSISSQNIINNNKLNTNTFDTFVAEEYNPLAVKVEGTVKQVDVEYYLSDSAETLTGGEWTTEAPSWVDGKFMWSRQVVTYVDDSTSVRNTTCIAGATGADGQDGLPGTPGANGITYYTWIRYSDNADGTGLYATPTANTLYIGIAYNKTSATPSSTKTDYVWSKFKGDTGTAGTPGANGITHYTWIKYADDVNGTNLSDNPTGKTYIGLAHNKTTATESTTPSDYTWALIKGADGVNGADGVGITSTEVKYQLHTNGTTAPTGSWLSSPPTPEQGKYLWVRTITTYTDNSSSTTYAVSYYATDGQTGSAGSDGADGTGIASTEVKYQIGTSGTVAPTGTWLDNVPTAEQGKYLWTRTIITYTDSSTSTAYSTSYYATDGERGSVIWTTTIAPATPNYTFTISNLVGGDVPRTGDTILYSYYKYTVVTVSATTLLAGTRVSIRGATGATGTGAKWYTGTAITGTSTTATVFSGSGITAAVVGDMYLNTSTNNTYRCTLAGNAATATWVFEVNIKGLPGDIGTGIESIVEEYAMNESKTNAPTEDWSTTQPTWVYGSYIWTRSKITYKDPTSIEYTTAFCSSEWEAADEVYNELSVQIDGKIESYYTSTDPSNSWSTVVEKETHIGDIWYNPTNQKTHVYYKDSEANPITYFWQWQNVPVELINTIGGKSTIYSGIVPTNYLTGDFWIIPLNCYSNTSSLVSSEPGFSVGMQIKLGIWTITIDSINVDTTIATYTLDIPATSNYDITANIVDENLEIDITSTSAFALPTGAYGGEVCVAIADGTEYDSTNWIKRSNYVPNDMVDIEYNTKVEIDNIILEERNNTSSSINNLNDSLVLNVTTLNSTIMSNKIAGDLALEELDDYTQTNINQLFDDTGELDEYISRVDTSLTAQIQLLNDAIINTVKTSGGNNLLRNSVGFKGITYWNVISTNIMQQFIQSINKKITISFRYRKVGINQATILLYLDSTTYETLLDTSDEVGTWSNFEYSYTSTTNAPYIIFNSTFTGIQDNDAESNGTSKSKLLFANGLVITDLMINYGDKQPWSPYFDEVYGKSHKLDAYGLELLDIASMNKSTLDSNSLDFIDSNDVIQSVFSKVETISDNYYANNSINIGNLNIVKLDDNNILEY